MSGEVIEMKDIITLVGVIIGSGIIQFLISRRDNRKGIEKQFMESEKKRDEEHKEVLGKIDKLEEKFDKRIEEVNNKQSRDKAELCRTHILRFADEQRSGVIPHSKEYFEQQLLDIKSYEKYCSIDPDFKNGKAEMAIEYIKNEYRRLYYPND